MTLDPNPFFLGLFILPQVGILYYLYYQLDFCLQSPT